MLVPRCPLYIWLGSQASSSGRQAQDNGVAAVSRYTLCLLVSVSNPGQPAKAARQASSKASGAARAWVATESLYGRRYIHPLSPFVWHDGYRHLSALLYLSKRKEQE